MGLPSTQCVGVIFVYHAILFLVFRVFNTSNDNKMSEKEFVEGMSAFLRGTPSEHIKCKYHHAFKKISQYIIEKFICNTSYPPFVSNEIMIKLVSMSLMRMFRALPLLKSSVSHCDAPMQNSFFAIIALTI